MQAIILQPPYPESPNPDAAQACLDWMTARMGELQPDRTDAVLLPEYATAPGLDEAGALFSFADQAGSVFLEKLRGEARRLRAYVVVGTVAVAGARRFFNRTLVLDPSGATVAWYDKTHLTEVEQVQLGLTPGGKPGVCELGPWRAGIAVCFDLYFPEYFETLAAADTRLIFCPSYQRSETPERIRTICGCRALDSGAYILRSSYAMPDASMGGTSLVAGPDGTILADAHGTPGVLRVEFDPTTGFQKPASHGRPHVCHRNLIEAHRRPGLYRPHPERTRRIQGSAFPRLCAHRGLSSVCPENTLPAFAAAAALRGVHEIEFDLWLSRDGVPVVCHDPCVDRTTDGAGIVTDMDWRAIRRLDAGCRMGDAWGGIPIPCLDEVLDVIDGRIGLNIHIKDPGPNGRLVRMVCDRLREEGVVELGYIAGDVDVLEAARDYAPEVPRACLAAQGDPGKQIKIAVQFGCERIQFGRIATPNEIADARRAGLICNLFWSDDPDDARQWCERGIQVFLTNAAHTLIAGGIPVENSEG